jgi:hypothetical protein
LEFKETRAVEAGQVEIRYRRSSNDRWAAAFCEVLSWERERENGTSGMA